LGKLIGRRTRLPINTAKEGQRFERGRIYIAPPGYHLLIERGIMRLESGPRRVGRGLVSMGYFGQQRWRMVGA